MEKADVPSSNLAVGRWILLGVAMLVIQVLLGGITRLTGSGLSITEWNIATGTLPPLHQQAWQQAFDKYKLTPQFQLLNADFHLQDFKFIFFWEWFHRLWARLIAVVFVAGFVYLLVKKKMKRQMIAPLLSLFILGALQGAVGWIMVASGLTGDAVYVQPVKLMLHFIFALALIAYAFWFGLQLLVPPNQLMADRSVNRLTKFIVFFLFIQLCYGALMAGNKAAAIAPTWPTINGDWIPAGLFNRSPVWSNFVDNTILIHFIHRGLAYLLFILVLVQVFRLYQLKNAGSYLRSLRPVPFILICIQLILGVSAVLLSPYIIIHHWNGFDWMALFHQLTGMLLLLSLVTMSYLVR